MQPIHRQNTAFATPLLSRSISRSERQYSQVLLSVVVALMLRFALVPLLGWSAPYFTFFLAVVYCAWVAGLGGGLLATVLCTALAVFMIHRPGVSTCLGTLQTDAACVLFVIEGAAISVLGQAQLLARRRALNSAKDAKQSLETLRVSEQQKSTILRVALDCIITIAEDGRVTEFNPAAEATFCYAREEAMGKPISELIIPPRLRSMHLAGMARYGATGVSSVIGKRIEIEGMRKGGEEFPLELAIVPTHANGQAGFTAYLRDISERREAAARQRAFLRDVLFSVTQGRLALCDTEHELPKCHAPTTAPIQLSLAGGMCELRAAARDAACDIGIDDERVFDFITAASEAAMNAVVHVGSGLGEVCSDAATGTVQVRISDKGAGIALENLPRATLQRGYTTAGTLGHGMKLMLETADRVYLLTGSSGTTVVLEQYRNPPVAEWLV